MREKVVEYLDERQVVYSKKRFELLENLREKVLKILEIIHFPSFVYGSVARGDVHKDSDVDILILNPVPSYKIEYELKEAGFGFFNREIIVATPNSVPKAHIYMDEKTSITLPLIEFSRNEEDFYRFGGLLGREEIISGKRVLGVNKRLLLISPTEDGHRESSIIGRESTVAKLLGVGIDIVNERIRVLTRRDKVGRTGTYLKVGLAPHETFESKLKHILDRDVVLRRQLKKKGY